jgi:hypothetical protein
MSAMTRDDGDVGDSGCIEIQTLSHEFMSFSSCMVE